MNDFIDTLLKEQFGDGMWVTIVSALIKIALAAIIAMIIYIILKLINTSFLGRSKNKVLKQISVTSHKKHLMMKTSIFMFFVFLFPLFPKLSSAFSIITLMIVVCDILDVINEVYILNEISKRRPIKGILQVVKIAICILLGIILISLLLNQNPVVLISGVGAFTAVISLVFKDAIVGLVAGIQITSEHIFEIGDWISIPSLGVEGEVKDIALITVKIQGFDNIMHTVPTSSFQTTPFKNWHKTVRNKMRQVKFSLTIDPDTIAKDGEETNLTLWRHKVLEMIKADPHYREGFATQCRTQGSSSGYGIPVEIYFTTDVADYDSYCEYVSTIGSNAAALLKEYDLKCFKTSFEP
ncbi:MAG: mechanosensitive ion channel [Clostridiales bacterium]|nr:mechanosensitive ion channel [Clostridiales bacterium]